MNHFCPGRLSAPEPFGQVNAGAPHDLTQRIVNRIIDHPQVLDIVIAGRLGEQGFTFIRFHQVGQRAEQVAA